MFHDDMSLSQRNVTDISRSQGEQPCSKDPQKFAVEQTVVNNPMSVGQEEQCPLYKQYPLYNSLGQPRCTVDSHMYFGQSVSVNSQQVHQTHDPSASYKQHNQADQLNDHRQWKPPGPGVCPSGPQLSKCCVPCESVSHRCLSVCNETRFSNNQTRPGWLTSVGTLPGSSCCHSCGCHSVGRDVYVKSFGSCNSDMSTSASVANKQPSTAGSFGFSDAFVSPSCVQGCEHCSVGIKDNSVGVYFDNRGSVITDQPPPPLAASAGVGCFGVTQASCYQGYGHRYPVGLQEKSVDVNLHYRNTAVTNSNPAPSQIGCFEVTRAPCDQGYDHIYPVGLQETGVNVNLGYRNSVMSDHTSLSAVGCFEATDTSCALGYEHSCPVNLQEKSQNAFVGNKQPSIASHVGEAEALMGFPFVPGCDHYRVGVGDANRYVHLKDRACSMATRDTAFVDSNQTAAAAASSFVEAEAQTGFPCTQACDDWQVGLENANVEVQHKDTSDSAIIYSGQSTEAGSFGDAAKAFTGLSHVHMNDHYSVGVQDASAVYSNNRRSGLVRDTASVCNDQPSVRYCGETNALMTLSGDRYRVGYPADANHVHPDNGSPVTSTAFTDSSRAAAAAGCDGVTSKASRSSPCFQACATRALQSDRVVCSETWVSSPFRSSPGRGSHVHQTDTANSLTEPYSPSAFEADEALSSEVGPPPIDTGVNLSSPEESENVASPNDSKNLYSSSKYETDDVDKAACDAAGMFDALMAYSPTASVNSAANDEEEDDDVKMADIDGCFVDEDNIRTGEVEVDMEDTPDYLVDEPRAQLAPNSARALPGREKTRVRYPQRTRQSLSSDRNIIVSLTQLRKLFGKKCKADDCVAELSSLAETEIGCLVEFHWKCSAGHQGVWATDERGSDVYGYISGADQSQFCGLLSLENSWLFSL